MAVARCMAYKALIWGCTPGVQYCISRTALTAMLHPHV